MTKIIAPKGTRDILPAEIRAWQHAESVFADICSRFGYQEIRIPTFEQTDLFQRGVGDTTDVVQKEMYTFLDKGGRSMTLRPEGTAGVVRSYLENGMASWPSPVRLYYNITAYRYEKMQKGRYREFHQFGCEIFGSYGPQSDAELVSLLDLFFRTLGLKQTSLHINSIGCPECRAGYHQILRDFLASGLDKLCETCQTRYDRNPLRILDCKEPACQTEVRNAPALFDHLCTDCREHFDGFRSCLDELGLDYVIDKGIVRGLDYYTRTVFEFVSGHVGTQGTICGGGRYDGLVEQIGGQPTPGIGFALGVERLLMELTHQAAPVPSSRKPTVYLAALGNAEQKVRQLALEWRRAGIRVETDLVGRSLKAQLKYAGKQEIRYVLVLGEDELESGEIRLKDMTDRTEQVLPLEEAVKYLYNQQAATEN